MERRLLKAVMLSSIIVVFSSGLLMLYLNHYLIPEHYLHVKVIFVLLMGYINGKYSSMYKELKVILETKRTLTIKYGIKCLLVLWY